MLKRPVNSGDMFFGLTLISVVFAVTLLILVLRTHSHEITPHNFHVKSNPSVVKPLNEISPKIDNSPRSAAKKSPLEIFETKKEALEVKMKRKTDEAPPIIEKPVPKKGKSIFIAMPAFDERDCHRTVFDAYAKAENPDRIFFGIYQQTGDNTYDCTEFKGEVDCPGHPVCTRMWQIGITRVKISVENSKGPTHARWMALQHMKNEDFIFVTDSHTRFRPNWDSKIIEFWKMTKNPYAILSHYPKGIDSMENNVKNWVDPKRPNPPAYGICGTYFEFPPNWMPRNANGCYIRGAKKPILTPFWCAGFSFMPAQANIDVPWDPHTEHMFWGEEFSYGSRLWTAGYDIYVPTEDIAFHRYGPDKEHSRGTISKVWNLDKNGSVKRNKGERRINKMWGVLELRTPNVKEEDVEMEDFDKYGLGDKRDLDDYWKFAGINMYEKGKPTFKIFDTSEFVKNGGLKRILWNDRENDPVLKNQMSE